MCRTFDSSLAEVCWEENVRLLAYSPLAMGLLTVGGPQAIVPVSCRILLSMSEAVLSEVVQSITSQWTVKMLDVAGPLLVSVKEEGNTRNKT